MNYYGYWVGFESRTGWKTIWSKSGVFYEKETPKKSKKNFKKHLTFQILCGNIYKSSRRNGDEQKIVSVDDGEGPPVPIPNTEVKLTCAEDT